MESRSQSIMQKTGPMRHDSVDIFGPGYLRCQRGSAQEQHLKEGMRPPDAGVLGSEICSEE